VKTDVEEALRYAVDHYPTVKAAVEQVTASAAGVTVARAGYLPRLDSLWQSNRATANNIFGQLLPQSVMPAITGPVLSSASSQSVWGSATGALFSWEPFDFGLRRAAVRAADAAVVRARADEALTRLDVQSAVGAAFLAVVIAEQAVVAAGADVERRDVRPRRTHVGSKADADRSTHDRLKAASATPGVVAGNDLLIAEKAAEASQNQVAAGQQSVEAARQAMNATRDLEEYLQVTAPFEGVVTERGVHPGALVGPASESGPTVPMVRLVQNNRLRLIVAVPEAWSPRARDDHV
jgi:Outer membrane efflux protein